MSDVSINYKGTEIANMSASGTKTLTTQGKYCEDDITINYTKPVPVEVEEKDVNFFDYDGTLLYSYTAQEFANLTELPANPTHSGLTAQGWNWTLNDAKTYVNEMGGLDIGQYFITDDNKTRLYLTIDNLKTFYLGIGLNGTATIEWGDGTSDTISGTSAGTTIYTQHTYSNGGDYVIKISSSGTYRLGSGSIYSNVLSPSQTNSQKNIIYLNMINKIELASNCEVGRFAFASMLNLKSITTTSSTKNADSASYNGTNLKYILCPNNCLGGALFQTCYNLKRVSIPIMAQTNTTALSFSNSNKIDRVWLPNNVINLNSVLIGGANDVSIIKLPNSIVTISNRAFMDAYGLKVADFRNFDHIPTLTLDNLFRNNQDDLKIVIPDNLYSSWTTANQWSAFASYMIKASDYVE